MTYSKQKLAFYRKLYLCHLIHQGDHNVPSLTQLTGMPRRTIQDCLKVMQDIDVTIGFEQNCGKRYNSGCYRILDWGGIHSDWVEKKFPHIAAVLKLPLTTSHNRADGNATDTRVHCSDAELINT